MSKTDYGFTFTHPVETATGEEIWTCSGELTREHGRYHLEDFEAKREGVEFDDAAEFLAYCALHGERPDLVALACEALEQEAEIDHEAARGDWLFEQAKERGLG
jgi:hypothetical protein